MREGEWGLTAAGNHAELRTPSRNAAVSTFNAKKSRVTSTSTKGLAFPRNFLSMELPKGTNIQHLNNMTTWLSLQQDILSVQLKNLNVQQSAW